MSVKLKDLAKLATQRLKSGFWQEEQSKRQKMLAVLADQGIDTSEAKEYLVASTKQQLSPEYSPEEEANYNRVKQAFLNGESENALGLLIDQELLGTMEESARQRYIFNLSAKLQDYRARFEKEQKYAYQTMSL